MKTTRLLALLLVAAIIPNAANAKRRRDVEKKEEIAKPPKVEKVEVRGKEVKVEEISNKDMNRYLKAFRKNTPYTADKIRTLAGVMKKKGVKSTGTKGSNRWVHSTYETVEAIEKEIRDKNDSKLNAAMATLLKSCEKPDAEKSLVNAIEKVTKILYGGKKDRDAQNVKLWNVKYGVKSEYGPEGIKAVSIKGHPGKIAIVSLPGRIGTVDVSKVSNFIDDVEEMADELDGKKYSKAEFLRAVATFIDTIERFGINHDRSILRGIPKTNGDTIDALVTFDKVFKNKAGGDAQCKNAVKQALIVANKNRLNPRKGYQGFPLMEKLSLKKNRRKLATLHGTYGI